MYYKISLPKFGKITKDKLLKKFELLEMNHKTARGEIKNISLHCKYDLTATDLDKFYSEEIDIYLKFNEETDDVKKFIQVYRFESVNELSNDVKFLCGNDGIVCSRIVWVKR